MLYPIVRDLGKRSRQDFFFNILKQTKVIAVSSRSKICDDKKTFEKFIQRLDRRTAQRNYEITLVQD